MKPVVIKGKPLAYNVSQQQRYHSALRDLVLQMNKETKEAFEEYVSTLTMDAIPKAAKALLAQLKNKFDGLFNKKSKSLATRMFNASKKASAATLGMSLKDLSKGVTLNTSFIPDGLKKISTAVIQENIDLIESIPKEYMAEISKAVHKSLTTGRGLQDLIPAIAKRNGQSLRRARNIALDQTRKAYNSVNRERLVDLGVEEFIWVHSGGGHKPRKSHQALSGKVFKFDKKVSIADGGLPVINKEQVEKGYEDEERGIPGQAINCKCTMNPVITFGRK